jgi:hypothetical protein
MATTTNYSWSTPDDTALVKDGAAAIRSLGTAIDTTVFTNAGAAVAKATVDAKGDLIAGTADNTVARLAVGTNGQVLTVDSTAATGLAYTTPASGSLTQLATGSLSGTEVSITSINQTYKDLRLVVTNAVRSGAGGCNLTIQTNTNTSSNYIYSSTRNNPGGTMALLGNKGTLILVGPEFSGSASYHTSIIEFIDYTNATTIVPIRYQGFTTANSVNTSFGVGCWYGTPAAVTSIQIGAQGDTFGSGSYVLFGVK